MGKAFLVILLIAVAAFVAYKQVHKPPTDEELRVKSVEEAFISASSRFIGAAGGGTAAGLDEAEAAAIRVLKTRAELDRVEGALTEKKAIAAARELRGKIDEFIRKNDMK